MTRCGVDNNNSHGNVTPQDATHSLTETSNTSTNLSAVDMSCPTGKDREDDDDVFANIPALLHDHSYLPTSFNGLVENALVYISGRIKRFLNLHVVTHLLMHYCCCCCCAIIIIIVNAVIRSEILGFVVRQAVKKLACGVCRESLVTEATSAIKDESYHLLSLKNNGGLVTPSPGTIKVVRAAESVIRQASFTQSRPIQLLEVVFMVRGTHRRHGIWD